MTQPSIHLPTYGEFKEVLIKKYGCTIERHTETSDGSQLDEEIISIERRVGDQTYYCVIDNKQDDDFIARDVIRTICQQIMIDPANLNLE